METRPHATVQDAIRHVRELGCRVYAAHLSDNAVDYRDVDYSNPCAVLFGAEKKGVSNDALALVDREISIPMYGMTESFNVSVACALILMEGRRQREGRGLYDACRLEPAEYNRLMVEWGQPYVARFCRAKGIPYPVLDDNGDVPPTERERLKHYG